MQRWFSLLENQSVEHELKLSLYGDLRLCYAEPQRAYHTFEHIKACLAHLDNVSNQLENAFEVELALWLHDVTYDPRSKTNELDSATYASEQLQKLNLPAHCIERVHQLILITQHPSNPQSDDAKILVDIDLSILGADKVSFAEYECNIRKEYRWVEASRYRIERKKVLQSFLAQPRIYQTDYFYKRKERQARKNLEGLGFKV